MGIAGLDSFLLETAALYRRNSRLVRHSGQTSSTIDGEIPIGEQVRQGCVLVVKTIHKVADMFVSPSEGSSETNELKTHSLKIVANPPKL